MTTLTPEQIRARIDALENLQDVMTAISDVSGVEFDDGELRKVHLCIANRNERAIAFVHGIPPELVLVGLQAMRAELEKMVSASEVTA